MNPTSKKFISLFLAVSLMMLSVNLYAKERRGAKLIVTKKYGRQISGELITVKPNSLLLLDTDGKDVSVGIADIKVIRIVKKSKALLGAGIGSAAGTLGGVLSSAFLDVAFGEDTLVDFSVYCVFGAIGLGIGAVVGGIIGAVTSIDKKIHFVGMTDPEIRYAMNKLRKKARIPDYK